MIELKSITKTFGKGVNAFQALRGIDLLIEKGEFVAIMGPSGSGKSTLMYILGALLRPTTGQYLLRGKTIEDLSNNELAEYRNKEVGFVFQQFNLLKKTSVLNNVALPGLYGAIPNLNERATTVLKKVGLGDKLKNLSNQLSGGQIQRVAVARALVMNPSIIMADEPTGNLDTRSTKEIMEVIKKIHDDGNTVILITHEKYIAEYADRLIKIVDGQIVEDNKTANGKKKK